MPGEPEKRLAFELALTLIGIDGPSAFAGATFLGSIRVSVRSSACNIREALLARCGRGEALSVG